MAVLLGSTLIKWIADHNLSRQGKGLTEAEANSRAYKLCETLLTAGLLQEVGKLASDEGNLFVYMSVCLYV